MHVHRRGGSPMLDEYANMTHIKGFWPKPIEFPIEWA